METAEITFVEASRRLASGEVTSVELCQSLLQRTAQVESKIGAFTEYDEDKILDQAKKSDERRAQGKALSDFDGVPVTVKDNIAVKGEAVRCSSTILDGLDSVYDATSIVKLKDAGCVLFGRANMDEFAMGSTTANSRIRKTLNPWNTDCVPGGSSGGSAAAVAAGETLAALGSDTGGSIRQPASFCGVVGLKPTYGTVSRYGLVAFASSLDQIGPLTKTVEDSAALFDIICGHDVKDSTSLDAEYGNTLASLAEADVKGLKIGVPEEFLNVEGLNAEVRSSVEAAIANLEAQGAEIVSISLPHTKYAIPAYYIIATAEASTNLARFDGVRYGNRKFERDDNCSDPDMVQLYKQTRAEGFGKEVQRRILLGTFVLSEGYADQYYINAQKVRTLILRDFKEAFQKCDIIAGPVSPSAAFDFGAQKSAIEIYLEDILTTSTNLAGLPGLSVPCGFTEAGMPVGLQLIGPALGEKAILGAAHCLEKSLKLKTTGAPC